MIWFIIIALIIIFIIISKSREKDNLGNPISTDKFGNNTIELDVLDPTVVSPERFLDFIENTPVDYLWQIENQLKQRNKLKDIVLATAVNEKLMNKSFDIKKYQMILQKVEEGSYDMNEVEIPEGFNFTAILKIAGTFISNRKKYIIFNVNEGDDLCLKPEPYNTFDKDAIAVFHNNQIIGYVPANDCSVIRDEIRFKHILKVADIIYKDDFIDVITYFYRSDEQHLKPEYYLNHKTLQELKGKKIKSEFFRPKKDAEDINAFYKKKVVITGDFNRFPDRNELAQLLFDSGADIDTCITERVSYLIAGENAGWKKLEKAKEFDLVIFNEKQILKIFDLEIN